MLEIEIQGARQVREALPEADQVFIEPPSLRGPASAGWRARASDSPEQIERRLAVARGRAGGRRTSSTHVIVNDDLDEAAARSSSSSPLPCVAPKPGTLYDQAPPGHAARAVDSHYACVLVAAKRARQINRYYHNLGEGTFDEYPPPMVETGSKNYLKIALEEIAAGQDQVPLPRLAAAALRG